MMKAQLDKGEIGKRCKEARKRAGLTLREMAERLGYRSGAAISNKENGLAYPSVEDLFFLSQESGCSIEWLVTGEEAVNEVGILKPLEVQLLRNYREMNELLRNELMDLSYKLKYGIKVPESKLSPF